jgi:hypothetical protein
LVTVNSHHAGYALDECSVGFVQSVHDNSLTWPALLMQMARQPGWVCKKSSRAVTSLLGINAKVVDKASARVAVEATTVTLSKAGAVPPV